MEIKKMKRIITILVLVLLTFSLYSKEFAFTKVIEIRNDNKSFYIRKDVNTYDDNSGNSIFFDKDGNLYGYNIENSRIFRLDASFNVVKDAYLGFGPYVLDFSPYNNGFLTSIFTGAAFYYDYIFNNKFIVHMQKIEKVDNPNYKAYYDEETDFLFFMDNEKKLNCIIHPSMEETQNQQNYHNVAETEKLIENGKYAPHLTLDEDHDLYIDGIRYRWGTTAYETKKYICTLNQKKKYIRLFDRKDSNLIYYTIPENEEVESITYHPNGDWYFLTINWTTNMHTLWRIENTWDPEWREQWFKTHKAETSLQDTSSTIVTLNEERLCKDNLRLRSEEAADSKVITTMQKGTKVKILKLGKAEVIDSINSNWVQVEVLKGGLDKDGNPIKTGTVGWCYGGYLE